MRKKMTEWWIKGQIFMMEQKERFLQDERGVSPIVATVLILLITVLLAVLFWNQLKTWFETLWASITGKASGIS